MAGREGYHWQPGEWAPSERQKQILDALVEGKGNAQIASQTGISLRTVRWHIEQLLGELGLHDRDALAEWWRRERSKDERVLLPPLVLLRRRPVHLIGLGVGLAAATVLALSLVSHPSPRNEREASRARLEAFVAELRERPAPTPGPSMPPDCEPSVSALPAVNLDQGDNRGAVVRLEWQASANPASVRACGELKLTDGATAAALADYDALTGGMTASAKVSPDGKLLAVMSTQNNMAPNSSRLRLMDIKTWSEIASFADTPLWTDHFAWSADSQRLYFAQDVYGNVYQDATGGWAAFTEAQVWEVDVAARSASLLLKLDYESFRSPTLSADGRTMYLLGFHTKRPGLHTSTFTLEGAPFLSVINLVSLKETARVEIPNLTMGRGDGKLNVPAVAFAETDGRYYIAHSDSNRVSVVDTRVMRLLPDVAPATKKAWYERLASSLSGLFLTNAEAKSAESNIRFAKLSPDGRYLFIAGFSIKEDGPYPAGKPMGLKGIDTRTMKVTYEEQGVDRFAFSHGGDLIFAIGYGWTYSADTGNQAVYSGGGLKVIDATSLRLLAHIEPDSRYEQMAMSADGRYLHLLKGTPERAEAMAAGRPCTTLCTMVDVVDAETLNLVASIPLSTQAVLICSLPWQRQPNCLD